MTAADTRALRLAVVATAREMNALGINRGKSGNVSARTREGFLVTPSALPYDRTEPGDVVFVTSDGAPHGRRRPSSEWRFHRDIYATRADVSAIVHTHSPFATTLACLDRSIPAFHYMVAVAGGSDVRCAPYATFGSDALAQHAVAALDARLACLLSHHGMIALGRDVPAALALAVDVEALAEIYCEALQLGEPALLDAEEMARVAERFRGYGPRRAQ